jgi:hypothetical protein
MPARNIFFSTADLQRLADGFGGQGPRSTAAELFPDGS